MSTDAVLRPEQLAERVRFDLGSAGLAPAPEPRGADAAGGFAVYVDEGQVHVVWFTHHRLDEADLDSPEDHSGRLFTDARRRYNAASQTMHAALGMILAAFGHRIHERGYGSGYIVTTAGAP